MLVYFNFFGITSLPQLSLDINSTTSFTYIKYIINNKLSSLYHIKKLIYAGKQIDENKAPG